MALSRAKTFARPKKTPTSQDLRVDLPLSLPPPLPDDCQEPQEGGSPGNQLAKMADPSSRVRSNSEFRGRLMEKVQVNVTETGKLAQQLLKSSRSHEVNY